MAKRSSTGRTHVSPGVYFKETELLYSAKSLGITTLGLAGETVKGPAFQPISISNWREFQSYFGGTNTEKFRGSKYPKYELPYIAKEFLKESKQLEVVRTLGLSGVNAGPAWVITATKHNCGEGYEYAKSSEEKQPYSSVLGGVCVSDENGIYAFENGKFAFNVPANVMEGEETTVESEVGVIDAFVNADADIVYFDDNAEEYFELLPEGLIKEFGDFESLKNYSEENNWGGAFYYINLNNELKDGKLAVRYKNEKKGAIVAYFNLEDQTVIASHNEAEYNENYDTTIREYIEYSEEGEVVNSYRYIVIPKSSFDVVAESLVGEDYKADYDFNISKVTALQFNYTNSDDFGRKLVENSGETETYESNEEPKTICIEDTAADYNNVVIAVLRSRGEHKKSIQTDKLDECGNPIYQYDGIEYYAKNVSLTPSKTLTLGDSCSPGYNTTTGDFNIDTVNYGKFTIAIDSVKGCDICGVDSYVKHEYDVSLNPTDKNYITRVLGTNPELGDADVYVEELYDIALEQLIYAGEINAINHEVAKYPYVTIVPDHEPVDDILTIDATSLTKHHLGKRYLYSYSESLQNNIKVKISKDNGLTWEESNGIVGHIYTVMSWNNPNTGKKEYFYGEFRAEDGGILKGNKKFTEYLTFYQYNRNVVKEDYVLRNCVKVAADNSYYVYADFDDADTANEGDVKPITLDFNNYKEEYRYATTPWIVSEMKGSGENVKLHKLFRFITISDGNNANYEVKVSIENIDPEAETFDVVVRNFYDSDVNPNVLERFGKCSLKPGESNYIGLRIGDVDQTYKQQSAYIMVEINQDDVTAASIPCGFLGYPVRNYNGFGLYELEKGDNLTTAPKQPYVKFNTSLEEDMKVKKQYFGMSDLIGIDEDILSYKGVEAYNEDPEYLTPCFHLDARILNGKPTEYCNGVYSVTDVDGNKQVVNVDGVTGYNWVTVAKTEITSAGIEPRIGLDAVMEGTIYEDKAARKFTVCFYGGWDGWDYYRTSRSNGDEYRYNKYKGSINRASGQGTMFSVLKNPEVYGFSSDTKIINTDYYAYLAAVKQLDNPKTVSINLFATPGIDYVNQKSLVEDVIDIVENDRGDSLYVVTTPDKPFGAGDSKSEMYSPEEAVFNLEDTEIDTNYACTYYPWEQYYDQDNNQYIYLPVTLDVVRDMAMTDNIAHPWYPSAGWNRGNVTGVGPRRKLKLAEQDVLYEGRINFINSFAKEGDKIWGDKNLQVHDGIMNRISKRRLFIRLKELLSNACIGLIFDPNDPAMAKTLESTIKNVLDPIKANRGITDYRIEIDDSVEARDRLELPGKVFVKPTQMLEWIDLELIATPQGVQWD